MLLASMVKGPEHEDHLRLMSCYERQLKKLGIRVKLNLTVNRSCLGEAAPDVLVFALGELHQILSVPGMESEKVLTSKALHEKNSGFFQVLWLQGPDLLDSPMDAHRQEVWP